MPGSTDRQPVFIRDCACLAVLKLGTCLALVLLIPKESATFKSLAHPGSCETITRLLLVYLTLHTQPCMLYEMTRSVSIILLLTMNPPSFAACAHILDLLLSFIASALAVDALFPVERSPFIVFTACQTSNLSRHCQMACLCQRRPRS